MLGWMKSRIGNALARYLSQPAGHSVDRGAQDASVQYLAAAVRPADVVLVDGNSRFSTAIKYLTQSTWSHAALYIGPDPSACNVDPEEPTLLEADIVEGVILVPLAKYADARTRICRPLGLTPADRERVIASARARLGHSYDLKNVIDLVRYLIRTPPVPTRWRRRMLALGSGDPTRAICSSLIAEAFQTVRYPILPQVSQLRTGECDECVEEILHIRHHSLFTPRDFDLSPYFGIVKPTLREDFDYLRLRWGSRDRRPLAGGANGRAHSAASPA